MEEVKVEVYAHRGKKVTTSITTQIPEGWSKVADGHVLATDMFFNLYTRNWEKVSTDDIGYHSSTFTILIRKD